MWPHSHEVPRVIRFTDRKHMVVPGLGGGNDPPRGCPETGPGGHSGLNRPAPRGLGTRRAFAVFGVDEWSTVSPKWNWRKAPR